MGFQLETKTQALLKKENLMTKKQKEEVALFRFGVICDLVGTLRLKHPPVLG